MDEDSDDPLDEEMMQDLQLLGFQLAWNRMMTVVVCLVASGLMLVVPFFTPHMAEVFADFDTELPTSTNLIIIVPPMMYVMVFGLALTLAIVKEYTIESLRIRKAINYALGVPLILFAILYAFSMFLPMIKLVQSVSR
ncbi:MAG: hypothetical protein GC159_21940 [Phycisphaera sp.]|nr:hypothetical protein [Phycisphaera sp.]